VRKTLLIFSFFFFLACDLDFQISKKISVDEFVSDEMKSLIGQKLINFLYLNIVHKSMKPVKKIIALLEQFQIALV
jgi:hypothetical protein